MLNIQKNAEKGQKMLTGKNWRYSLDTDDLQNIYEENKADFIRMISTAFYVGVVQGAKIAKKETGAL